MLVEWRDPDTSCLLTDLRKGGGVVCTVLDSTVNIDDAGV
jgi:hypothetical protein